MPVTKKAAKQFVEAAHGDLAKVRQLLEANPQLLNVPNGRETALGAACQMRRKDMVEYLLSRGAAMDIYAACVLGQIDTVTSILDADPALIKAKAGHAHNKPPLYFAAEQNEVRTLLESRGAGQTDAV
jgi:ankyrin repeat protein